MSLSVEWTALKLLSFAMRSRRSLSPPFSFITFAASMECSRMASWRSWRLPPSLTQAIRMFSVAMNGSASITRLLMTWGQTTTPEMTFVTMSRMESTARKDSGRTIRRLAESSRVRSNHWVACVWAVLATREMTYRAREQTRSLLIGFLLYAIAEDPTWFFPNGSSSSRRFIRSRMSLAILLALCAIPESTLVIWKSSLRV
mmetsp:Transcript_9866/g.24302  ORF Transcript_9866/g.24302 Transcript_9866/m.24302 type:complete len:201 (+) Transcript_9866:293-895(+)